VRHRYVYPVGRFCQTPGCPTTVRPDCVTPTIDGGRKLAGGSPSAAVAGGTMTPNAQQTAAAIPIRARRRHRVSAVTLMQGTSSSVLECFGGRSSAGPEAAGDDTDYVSKNVLTNETDTG
jgi:hypothetical protein